MTIQKRKNEYAFSQTKYRKKPLIKILIVTVLICTAALFLYDYTQIGKELDSYKGVAIYYNGIIYTQSHGRNYTLSGYYFGQKWQCVEYVKRFYYQEKNHEMPNVFGNAKDFFDISVEQGQMNTERGLVQYRNGYSVPPESDDILVFNDTKYGHVAIITDVTESYVEVIQQNVLGKSRDRLPLRIEDGGYIVGSEKKPAGWLRV